MAKDNRKVAGAALGLAGVGAIGYGIYYLRKKPPAIKAGLFGEVTDSSTMLPLSGVLVTVDGHTARTDASGGYELALEAGDYHVAFEKEGYIAASEDVIIKEGVREELNVALQPFEPSELSQLYATYS